MTLAPGNKKQLRGTLRAARRGLGRAKQMDAAKGLLQQLLLLEAFVDSRRIALYVENDGEISTADVMRWCQQNGKHPYLPVVQRTNGHHWLLFGELRENGQLAPNHLGIPEPVLPLSELTSAQELDLVMLPLVGFDSFGNRLGMGGGFYDTTFEFVRETDVDRPVLIGIAHEIQRVKNIDAEPWDIPLPVVVTDSGIYRFGS